MNWKNIGEQIRTARTGKGWTQERLARIVGLAAQSIQALEHGYGHRIPAGQLAAICSLLGLQIMLGAQP